MQLPWVKNDVFKIVTNHLKFLGWKIKAHVKWYDSLSVGSHHLHINFLSFLKYCEQRAPLMCSGCNQGRCTHSCNRQSIIDKWVASNQAYSSKLEVIGISSSENRPKAGCSGTAGLEGGFGHSSKAVNDCGRSFTDCLKSFWSGSNLLLKTAQKQ